MFTGIITDVGVVQSANDSYGGRRMTITTAYDTSTIDIGASIACAGVCLTVVALDRNAFSVDVSLETLARTTLG